MANAAAPIAIQSLRGGLNDTDPPNLMKEDECTVADNVEFFWSALGERRLGCQALSITNSDLEDETKIAHLSQWSPTNLPTVTELFAVAATPGVSVTAAKRATNGTWSEIVPGDAITNSSPDIYGIKGQPLNNKLFLAYRSAFDRLHLLNAAGVIRRAGLGQPNPPTAAPEGAGTAFHYQRNYRVRYTIQDAAGKTIARSEPSTELSMGQAAGAGYRITKPATIGEGETHWEIEAAVNKDHVNFYRIVTLPVGTTTYDDELIGVLSTMTAKPASVSIPPGYVQLTDAALVVCVGGGVSNGTYSDGTTFAVRGWVTYNSAGAYLSTFRVPVAGDVGFASLDVAFALETATTSTFGGLPDYAANGVLTEVIGTYLTQPSFKFIIAVDDRLVGASHWTDTTRMSSVYWSPVYNDPGVGNDERLPLAVNNSLDLDNGAGGPITGLATGLNGSWYVFKWSRIYKMGRTGDVNRAYQASTVSTIRGAIEGSVFAGVDSNGSPCIFFLDPKQGPSMVGVGGVQTISGLGRTWNRINVNATVVARGVYYPYKCQAHWWIALETSSFPNYKLISQVSEHQQSPDGGVHRGWSTATGRITEAFCVALLTETVTVNGVTSIRDRPFIGLSSPDYIQECDNEEVTDDAGIPYIADLVTAPFFTAGLLTNWGVIVGALLASANEGSTVKVSMIKNFGIEATDDRIVNLSPKGTESYVFRHLDSFVLSEALAIQFRFTDA